MRLVISLELKKTVYDWKIEKSVFLNQTFFHFWVDFEALYKQMEIKDSKTQTEK